MLINRFFLGALLGLPLMAIADPTGDDSCSSLLALINRPTVGDSVCVVKSGQIMIEGGYLYFDSYPNQGHGQNYPELQLRFGLPASTEFTLLPPNYIDLNGGPSGTTATVMGVKHQFQNTGHFLYSAEGIFTLPTGSDEYGSDGLGAAANVILNYSFNSAFSISGMFGVITETTSTNSGGERYYSFNPDLVFAWQFTKSFQWYSEFYGRTKTSPDQGSGFNMDTGFQYLPTPNIELDIEYGQRLSGELGGFARYIGAGGAIRF